jgi:hypothetical protein
VRATLILLACAAAPLSPHDVISTKITWSREISRLVYARCVACHRDGGATFSLETYTAARPWAKAIRDEVLCRRMPPWGAVRGFGRFSGDVSLSQEEMDTIAQWVEGGAPEGDPALLPKVPPGTQSCFLTAPAGRLTPVHGAVRLERETVAIAIRPAGDVLDSARVVAILPDSSIIPMLWLYQYRRAYGHEFVYRAPLRLPAGTRIESQPPIMFTLITR